mgnify:FL=1
MFVPLGLTLSPMLGAAAMSLSSFCVVTNALRLNLFDLHDARRDHKRASHLKEVPEIKEETTMKKTISIEGMMCTHCEATVKKALEALPETMRCDAFRGFRIVYPKAVKDTKTVTLKYTAADDGAFVCLYSADTLCTIVRFET